jgi:hypothetical protein
MTEDGSTVVARNEYPKALQMRAQRRLIQRYMEAGVRVAYDLG